MVKTMPDQSSASTEHALIQEITGPLATLPADPLPVVADVEFPTALRGYDRLAVDAYVRKTSQLVAELQATRSPDAAIRRALERVGEEVSGILQRAHETAARVTSQSRSEAEDRLEVARQEAAQIVGSAEQRVRELDAETDRIWAERHRIVEDTRELAQELLGLTDTAANSFPAEAVPVGRLVDAAEARGGAVTEEAVEPRIRPRRPSPRTSSRRMRSRSWVTTSPSRKTRTSVFRGEEEEPASDVEPTAVLPVVEPHAAEDDDKLR